MTKPTQPTQQNQPLNVAILGANGAIGNALLHLYEQHPATGNLWALSRTPPKSDTASYLPVDIGDEQSLAAAAADLKSQSPLDVLIIATGALHSPIMQPEKALSRLTAEGFMESIRLNTLGPALAAKHLLPLLNSNSDSRCGILSARVGSIADNHLGGWYSYRSAKAALNMFIRTAAIEFKRSHKHSTLVGLHPGTVDSELSRPFQRNVAPEKLFIPEFSASCLVKVLHSKTAADSGHIFAWDNTPIPY